MHSSISHISFSLNDDSNSISRNTFFLWGSDFSLDSTFFILIVLMRLQYSEEKFEVPFNQKKETTKNFSFLKSKIFSLGVHCIYL